MDDTSHETFAVVCLITFEPKEWHRLVCGVGPSIEEAKADALTSAMILERESGLRIIETYDVSEIVL